MASDDLKKISAILDLIKDQQSVMNGKLAGMDGKLDQVQETQDSHTVSLIKIESTLEGYADAYKINKGNIERLDASRISYPKINLFKC